MPKHLRDLLGFFLRNLPYCLKDTFATMATEDEDDIVVEAPMDEAEAEEGTAAALSPSSTSKRTSTRHQQYNKSCGSSTSSSSSKGLSRHSTSRHNNGNPSRIAAVTPGAFSLLVTRKEDYEVTMLSNTSTTTTMESSESKGTSPRSNRHGSDNLVTI